MSDQIITDIKLIGRYSRHNEDADWRFRSFLKAHPTLSNKALDSAVREETDRIWAQIDCTKCANCCKVMDVVIDDADIKRLAARFKMPVRQFEQLHVRLDQNDNEKYFSSKPCQFLGDNNICTVYDDRPQACRDFPFLHKEGFRQRTLAMLSNQEVCPIVFNVWQALKRRLWRRKF